MAANQKIERLAQAVAESLALRLGVAVTKAYDANKDLYVQVGAAAGGAIVKFEVEAAPASGLTDGLGLTQRVYTPHIAKVLFDSNAPTTEARKFVVLCEVAKLGTKVELYEKAADVAVASIVADNFVAAYQDLNWGVTSQQ